MMLKHFARPALPVLFALLVVPGLAGAQSRARNRDADDNGATSGQAVPRGSIAAPTPAAAPAPTPPPAAAAPSAPAPAAASGRTRGAAGSDSSNSSPSQGARPRQGVATVGTAVARGSVPAPPRPNPPVAVPPYYGSYWPWGFGGLGFGFASYYGGYYNALYDPWYGGYGYGGGYPPSSYTVGLEGALRLKIKPRDAQVFVDGYYVGVVDSFDGTFQRLHVEAGPHRIEVRAAGFEPLVFDVRVQFDETTNLEGALRRLP
jgi:hypothetical protein